MKRRIRGKFNYHLKVLADLIEKDPNSRYTLTEKGHLAAQFLQTFKEKKTEPSTLCMADALLISFVGFVLTIANPFFWSALLAVGVKLTFIPLFEALSVLSIIYALIVPGALMWRLAVRRSRSHDAYDLYKSPFLAFLMLLPLLAVMLYYQSYVGTAIAIVGRTIHSANVTSVLGNATITTSSTTYVYSFEFPMFLVQYVILGFAFSFLGVALSELASRMDKKYCLSSKFLGRFRFKA